MVEPEFLIGLGAVFLAILVLILRSSLSGASSKEQFKKEKKQKPLKERKTKGPKKNALKKEKRPNEVREWSGIDTAAKDAQEMLEFLKGKDPAELAKHQKSLEKQQINNNKQKKQQQQQQPKKGGNKHEEVVQSSEDSSNETTLTEGGFSVISKKVNDKKKNQNKEDSEKKKDSHSKKPKPFFKPAPGEEGEQKNEKKPRRERQERRPQSGEENVEGGEKKKRVEGEQENRERKPRRERPEGEVVGEGEERPRRERQERPVRKPLPTVAPIVKYEQADLNDILNSITQDFKPKPKAHRISTVFSKIPRNIVITILSKLEARDLVALSEVNHYFSSVARKDSLWKELLLRDFGIRDFGKYRNFRAAYRGEVKKRRAKEKKEVKEILPQDEPKDSKAKKDNKKVVETAAKEVEQAREAETTEEQ